MIHIRITLKDSHCHKVVSKGHAGYAEEGYDIICAAVSVLMVNTANSLETLTDDSFSCEEGDGYVALAVEDDASKEAILLMDSLRLGLVSIRESYGDTYLHIETKEE